jgi:hypothetical protein
VLSQGPAIAALALKTTIVQPARMIRFVFICSSSGSGAHSGTRDR